MALSDGIASVSQVEAASARTRERAELARQAAQLEAARASEEREYTDDFGNVWRYVILDDSQIRITSLIPSVKDIVIPESIEELPVKALGQDACAHLDDIETVVCPDSMISIGYCAFRNDHALRSIHLPYNVSEFDSDWFRRCISLEHIDLPGSLEKIDPYIFDIPNLRSLRIGYATSEVEPGSFTKSKLERIEVDEANEFLTTDGLGLYSKDMRAFVALCVPLSEYEVVDGVVALSKKAFSSFRGLERVSLPDSVELISEYAYSKTGILKFAAPANLRYIMDRAFFDCTSLQHVQLNEALVWVGDNAFSNTQVDALALPGSIEHLGHPLAARSKLVYSGEAATLSIDSGSTLMLDGEGGLYEKLQDGAFRLLFLMDPKKAEYSVIPGTTDISKRAFAGHERIECVEIPEGVLHIEEEAFKSCRSLRHISLPSSLKDIGKEAFLGCNLEELILPRDLERVGEMALVMYGAHHGSEAPSLKDLRVDPQNPRFFMSDSLLMEKEPDGSFKVVHYTDTDPRVVIPRKTKSIAPYAFNGARNIKELFISTEVTEIGMRGLAVDCHIDLLHIDLEPQIEGHEFFEFAFPKTDRGTHHLHLSLGVPQYLDLEGLFAGYDSSIVHARNFDSHEGGVIVSLYEQSRKVMDRLQDPVLMSSVNRDMLTRFIRNHLENICIAISKRNDKLSIDRLADLEFIDADNIVKIIEHVGVLQDASMTSYLLTMKKERFDEKAMDFSL